MINASALFLSGICLILTGSYMEEDNRLNLLSKLSNLVGIGMFILMPFTRIINNLF